MRRAVSVSLGSSSRDHEAEIDLLGTRVRLTRVGTDGDVSRAERVIRDLAGRVDALGLGGAVFALELAERRHRFHTLQRLRTAARATPFVDGAGLKNALEGGVAPWIERALGAAPARRRVLFPVAADRWWMATSFAGLGYECLFGDLAIALGVPLPLRSAAALARVARVTMPVVGRLPIAWLYPTGARQDARDPRHRKWFAWADVVAGDFLYIRRHMPARLDGAIVCTNTTTPADVELLRAAGVRALVTTTPVLAGRTFGTNLMEAALLAAAGAREPLAPAAIAALARDAGLAPALRTLNETAP